MIAALINTLSGLQLGGWMGSADSVIELITGGKVSGVLVGDVVGVSVAIGVEVDVSVAV